MQKVTPFLWFDGQAEPAARFSVSLLPDSQIERVNLIGGTYAGARPRRRSTTWTSARPVRPLPSANGWMVSNCAWTRAAGISGGRSILN